jgi:hypothetical protein
MVPIILVTFVSCGFQILGRLGEEQFSDFFKRDNQFNPDQERYNK